MRFNRKLLAVKILPSSINLLAVYHKQKQNRILCCKYNIYKVMYRCL